MFLTLPEPDRTGPLQEYIKKLLTTLRQAFVSVISSDQAAPRVLLQSENGTVYTVVASNDGAITTTNFNSGAAGGGALDARVTALEGEVTTLDGDVATINSNVATINSGAAFKAAANTFTAANSFTGGSITVPTKTAGTNTTDAASCAFVQTAVGGIAGPKLLGSAFATDALLRVVDASFGIIPGDDTIPQITEGGQVMTLTYTPRSASSKLRVRAKVAGASGGSVLLTLAVFRDSGANAIAAGFGLGQAASWGVAAEAECEVVSGSTAATTFTVRVGVGASGQGCYLNGASGTRLYGGLMRSTLSIEELA